MTGPGDVSGSGLGIGADVILEFDKSIKNIQDFGAQMEALDAKFGSLDQRIDNMKSSLSALSAQTSKASGSNLRKSIEAELNNIVMANGIAMAAVGTAPIKVKQETVKHLFARIDAELNRAILKQVGNINVKIDPSFNTGTVPIGKNEFAELNKEIARLVKVQTANLVNAIKKSGASLMQPADVQGLQMSIGKGTVSSIIQNIKEQIKPIILSPEVNKAGVSLEFTAADMDKLMKKIKAQVKAAMDGEVSGTAPKSGANIKGEITRTTKHIDSIVETYVKNINGDLGNINPRTVETPMKNLSKRLQQHIADDLRTTPDKLLRDMPTIDSGSKLSYELQRQFQGLETTVTNKLTRGTSEMMTELKRTVRAVDFEPSSSLKHHLISEINKLNNDIVKKIRESIDAQFAHMRGEISTVNTDPSNINRNNRIRSMSGSRVNSGNTYNTYNTTNSANNQNMQGSTPVDRNGLSRAFGLEGAIENTLRHIVAGSAVGAPMMALYQAFETFQTSQNEQMKIIQNMSLKGGQFADDDGNTNWNVVDEKSQKLMSSVRGMSNLYGLGYSEMSQVAGVASRLTNDESEAQEFTEKAAQIYRVDNESDLVGTIAPGLEAVMAQFKLSVWDLDKVVNAFAVATTVTKATSDEVIKAMSRSGSALNASGVSAEQAISLNAMAIQTSGQSGESIGNMFKTVAARVTLPSVVESLAGKGIDVYETNEDGLKERRNLVDILKDTQRVANGSKTGDDEMAKIMLDEGGGYHYSKVMSFLEDMGEGGMYSEITTKIKDFNENPEKLQEMLARTMGSPTVTMERAGVSVNNALTSVLEALSPEIQILSKNLTNLSQTVEQNADTVANVISVLTTALLGFGAMYGLKRVGGKLNDMGEFDKRYDSAKAMNKYFGGDTLTGRQKYGAPQFLDSHVIGNSREASTRLGSKDFYKAATKDDSPLKGYFEELSNLDNDRRREIRQYTQKYGKADSLEDLFSIMDESRGYRPDKKPQLSADELHQRTAFNARSTVNNKAMGDVLSQNFARELVDSVSDRDTFDNLDNDKKSTATRLGEMDDTERKNFHNYLSENHSSATGNVITDYEGMSKAMDDYEKRSNEIHAENRRGSVAFRDLGRAVSSVSDAADGIGKSKIEKFMDIIDTIPQRARGAIGALGGIAKGLLGIVGQIAGAMALGDVIGDYAENALLTDGQKDIRDFRNEDTDVAKEYAQWESNGGDWGQLYKPSQAASGLGHSWNWFKDIFQEGNQNIGSNDIGSFEDKFESWMEKEYGTTDYKDAIKSENKSRKKEAKENYDTDEYDKVNDLKGLTDVYLQDTGKNEDLQEMEEKQFLEDYKKTSISNELAKDRQAKAEAARKDEIDKMYEDGELQYFSVDSMKERVQEKVQAAQDEGDLSGMNALLEGVKSDSEAYLKIRLDAIKQEAQAYKDELSELQKFVDKRRSALQQLEDEGKRWAVGKDGKAVYSEKDGKRKESKEYNRAERALKEAEEKQAEIEKETAAERAALRLQAQREETTGYVEIAQKNSSRASNIKTYSDTLNSLSMNTDSAGYIDSEIGTSQGLISTLKSELSDLQSQQLADPDNILPDAILSLEQQIASAELEVKNLRLQRLATWRTDFTNDLDDAEIKNLQDQVNMGVDFDSDSAVGRDMAINNLQNQKNIIDRNLAERNSTLNELKKQGYGEGSAEYEQVMKDIRDLTKQSLQAQLGIHEQLKTSIGGTFNLPDGVKVMSQYDYMASKGTHSNMTIQSGDMYLNITLPNVTDKIGSQQLAAMGVTLGQGLATGRADGIRTQASMGVTGYKTF